MASSFRAHTKKDCHPEPAPRAGEGPASSRSPVSATSPPAIPPPSPAPPVATASLQPSHSPAPTGASPVPNPLAGKALLHLDEPDPSAHPVRIPPRWGTRLHGFAPRPRRNRPRSTHHRASQSSTSSTSFTSRSFRRSSASRL
jgi:hypothetical protein